MSVLWKPVNESHFAICEAVIISVSSPLNPLPTPMPVTDFNREHIKCKNSTFDCIVLNSWPYSPVPPALTQLFAGAGVRDEMGWYKLFVLIRGIRQPCQMMDWPTLLFWSEQRQPCVRSCRWLHPKLTDIHDWIIKGKQDGYIPVSIFRL